MTRENPGEPSRFTYRETKSGTVQLFSDGKGIATLKERAAQKFLNKVESCNSEEAQLLMAKLTGHFKQGNERASKNRRSTS